MPGLAGQFCQMEGVLSLFFFCSHLFLVDIFVFVSFQGLAASIVFYLFIRRYQEKISAACLSPFHQELQRWIMT